MNLVDRDAIITKEGLIFRVLGYSHPQNAYFCDLEYAPARIFESKNPKSPRGEGQPSYYKFYEDESWKFIQTKYPRYLIRHRMLDKQVAGVKETDIAEVRKPSEMLTKLRTREPTDTLVESALRVIAFMSDHSCVDVGDLGVFGSLLHGFHHPQLSDIDLVVYGRETVSNLLNALGKWYIARNSLLRNEFDDDYTVAKNWRFVNYSEKEYLWHQRRKLIYGVFQDEKTGRIIKTEFEPVKARTEVVNEFNPQTKITQRGWVKMIAKVTVDEDAAFIPSCYVIEPIELLEASEEATDAERIVSYMEEFRLQACVGDKVYVEGNLEEVLSPEHRYFQVMLTYCPRYYEQVLKQCDSI